MADSDDRPTNLQATNLEAPKTPFHTGNNPAGHVSGDGVSAPAGLTKNEGLVFQALNGSNDPLKAYEILDELKGQGIKAPMTVYRALDGLEEKGLIHKLEAMNSFMVCNHEGPHAVQSFLVCESCQKVEEIGTDGFEVQTLPALGQRDFNVKTARLEIRGICGACEGGL